MSSQVVPPSSEYVTDVPYERTFVHQLTPSTLRLVAALNGITPPPDDDFDYLELGTANGDTLVALAAANPRARFVGVDINPEHVAFANDLAKRSGVANVRFLERDFEGLDRENLPSFDFVAAHGILSWVGPAKRAAVLDLAKTKLKPGGLLYVSYNALPGWSAIEPLRRLMLESSAASTGATLDRAQAGVAFVQGLSDAGAAYFANHPTVKSMLAIMEKAGLPYVVHEYFHAHWCPMYFADLAREMLARDIEFVGQLPLPLNIRDLALPPALKEIAKTAPDRVAYETIKDFALNELFRSDVFVKSSVLPAESALRAFFEGTSFGTTAAQIERGVKLPIYSLDFNGPVYDAILPEIAAGTATASELAARPKLAGFGTKRIADCLQNLTLGGQVVPMRSSAVRSRNIAAGKYRVPLAYNRLVLEDVLSGGGSPPVLASPATGTGVSVTLLEMLCIHLLTEVEASARASWLRRFSHRKTPRLTTGDREITNGDEIIRIVTRELDGLGSRDAGVLAKWVELGLVEPVA
jgi:SAM-dependent methyltransferase